MEPGTQLAPVKTLMTLSWLLGWWNLLFIVPFLLALAYLGLYIATGLTFGDPEADVDADADVQPDIDTDAHMDVQGDVDADTHLNVEGGVDHDLHAGASANALDSKMEAVVASGQTEHLANDHAPSSSTGAGLSLLSLVGVGRVPLSLLLMVMLLTWGVVGFAVNQLVHDSTESVARIAWTSIPVALIA
jgi:hypothetical protein